MSSPTPAPLQPLRRPPALKRGARLAVVAPAGPMLEDRLEAALAPYRAAGYALTQRRSLGSGDGASYLAGDDATRLEELIWALTSPEVDGVLCVRGGYGSMRLLPALREALPAGTLPPRPLVGFSDITALHALCAYHLGWQSLHAPMVFNFAPTPPAQRPSTAQRQSWESLYAALIGGRAAPLSVTPRSGHPAVEGVLFGGNLSLIAALYGTPYLPSLEGVILLLEDVGESPYRLDRLLTTLWLGGAAREVVAVALGSFTSCGELSPSEASAHVARLVSAWGVPVAEGLEVGHQHPQRAVWLGERHRLDLASGQLTPLGGDPAHE